MALQNNNVKKAFYTLFNNDIKNYIFIYTPPKVGSTTLVSSLRISLGNTFKVIHIHDDIMLNVLTGIHNVTVNELITFASNEGKTVYVIDVYRTPIERKMSEFFEKISPYHFNNSEENINKYSIKRVSDRFNKLFPYLENGDHYFEKYDIGEPPIFDFNKKYTLQFVNGINYIKLRLLDSKFWSSILSEILKMDVVIINDYQTDNKKIGDLYKRFKNEYRLPLNYLELIQNCTFFNFYYNEQERNEYLQNWGNKLGPVFEPYTKAEYDFYMNICLENQAFNDIQSEHYIDEGCVCQLCGQKRSKLFLAAKKGHIITDKILHNEVVSEEAERKATLFLNLRNKTHKNRFLLTSSFS